MLATSTSSIDPVTSFLYLEMKGIVAPWSNNLMVLMIDLSPSWVRDLTKSRIGLSNSNAFAQKNKNIYSNHPSLCRWRITRCSLSLIQRQYFKPLLKYSINRYIAKNRLINIVSPIRNVSYVDDTVTSFSNKCTPSVSVHYLSWHFFQSLIETSWT